MDGLIAEGLPARFAQLARELFVRHAAILDGPPVPGTARELPR